MKKMLLSLTLLLTLPAWSQAVSPPDRAFTTSTRPTISADYGDRVRNARIWVDGTEFTDYLQTRGDTVTLVPPYNLDYGNHTVQILTDNGRQTNWSFAIVHNDQAYQRDPYYYPNNNPNSYPNTYPYDSPNNRRYPTEPYDDNDNRIDLRDILPELLPRILNNRY